MSRNQTLIKRQREIGEEIELRFKNFKKDGKSRKTPDLLAKRFDILQKLWDEALKNHELLLNNYDENAPYFRNNYMQVVNDLYDQYAAQLASMIPNEEIPGGQNSDGNEDENLNTGDQDDSENWVTNDDARDDLNQTSGRKHKKRKIKKPVLNHKNFRSKDFQGVIFKNGMSLERNIKLFDLKHITVERYITKLELIATQEFKEITYFRVHDELRDNLRDLSDLNAEIQVLGSTSCDEFLTFMTNDVMGTIGLRAEEAITAVEKKIEDVTKSHGGALATDVDVKLTRIVIPTFDGKYTEWQTFHDLYTRLIHSNNKLSEAVKMQYLMNNLTDEAARLISHFTARAENYPIAWNLLVNKYNKNRILVSENIEKLIALPNIQEGSHKQLQAMHDAVYNITYGMESVLPTKNWGEAIILQTLQKKLDKHSYRSYEDNLKNPKEFQKLQDFMDFLNNRIIRLENMANNYPTTHKPNLQKGATDGKADGKTKKKGSKNCKICSENHFVKECKIFTQLSVDKRLEKVRSNKLCTNCLRKDHIAKKCQFKGRCPTCKKAHHSLLHNDKFVENKKSKEQTKVMNIGILNNECEQTHTVSKSKEGVILTTMLVQVMVNGYTYNLRALLDQGSTTNIMTEEAANLLNLKRHKTHAEIAGLGNSIKVTSHYGTLTMKSMYNQEFKLQVSAFILDTISEPTPSLDIMKSWDHLENLNLADPKYRTSAPIDIILGGGVYARILLPGVIKAGLDEPIAQQTELGWIISGPSQDMNINARAITLVAHIQEDFDLQKLWDMEEIADKNALTLEELDCEEIYKQSHSRQENGKYMVHLPFKIDDNYLGKSRHIAVATLLQLEKSFRKDPELKVKYIKCLQEYFDNNQIKAAQGTELELSHLQNGIRKFRTNYLPHHGVKKESEKKFRVVFDASRKTASKFSLNDQLMVGPVIQDDLVTILTKWRTYEVVFTADIQKMYRQIDVLPQHAEYQRMVWRENEDEQIKDYVLTTVTFGTASAPHTAVRTLHQLAIDERKNFPVGAKILENDFYVDDVMTGGQSVNEANEKQLQLRNILQSAGMNLRKFASNSNELMEHIPLELRELQVPLEIDPDQRIKTLGVAWYPNKDYFKYAVSLETQNGSYTKRIILAEIAKIYDPLGWISPIIVKGKILMQTLWTRKMSWDQQLDEDISTEWETIRGELTEIEKIQIPRWIKTRLHAVLELHGFSDASEAAFAAVIYARIIQENGQIDVSIICAKTKVAPLKQISIPRLELCGAVLLSKLMKKVQNTLSATDNNVKLWSDSTITLAWIKDQPRKYNTFVANRIGEIQTNLKGIEWYHVKGAENPADIASRGTTPSSLTYNELWWKGPHWLRNKDIKYNAVTKLSTDVELKRKEVVHTTTITNNSTEIFSRFSNFDKMVRIMSYCWRFIRNLQRKKQYDGSLTINELNDTEYKIILLTQIGEFSSEMERTKNKQKLNNKSGLSALNPFLDKKGQLRVGGHLQNSNLKYDQKHPIILPYKSYVTKLKISQVHRNLLHGGVKLTTVIIRQKYWVIKGKRLIKTVINNCVKCVRAKGSVQEQMMGNLPAHRVTPSRPFINCGVDYAGPLQIKSSKLGRAVKYDGYIALFICLATKAVHIEIVTSQNAEEFIAAFKRLVNRRGPVCHMYSDNAGNFKLTNKILKLETEQQKLEYQSDITEGLLKNGTQFHVIPPKNPTHGGIWERNIGSFKHHLKRVLGEQKLTYEVLNTLAIQIEGVLNSRPLCPMTDDPEDLEILTPGHFLIGASIISPPESSVLLTKINKLTRWKLVQRMYEDFWKSCKEDYLNHLQLRTKLKIPRKNIEVGDIVALKEEMVPPTRWPLGRVININPGKDDIVRVVTVKTQKSTLKRPINKLCLLPTKKEEVIAENHDKKCKSNPRNDNGVICLFAALLVTSLLPIAQATSSLKVTKFESQPGIYFDNLGDTYISKDNWKIISYFNLSNYWEELNVIQKNINRMEIYCGKSTKTPTNICSLTLAHFEHLQEEIQNTNNIIHHERKDNRTKRQIVIGALAIAALAGHVISWSNTMKYKADIEQSKINEHHLNELLRNQTSIIDATYNIIKDDENKIYVQIQKFNNEMNAIRNETRSIQQDVVLTNLAISTYMKIMYYRRMQDTLIDIVMDAHNGKSNILMLTPLQLQQQINLIHENQEDDSFIPGGSSGSNLLEIYKSIEIQSRITADYIIIQMTLPVVNNETFDLYKLIPVPTKHGKELISIQPTSEFLFINKLGTRYFPSESTYTTRDSI